MVDNSTSLSNLSELLQRVYGDLRRYASWSLAGENAEHSFQTTDLVHEVYLRLAKIKDIDWNDEKHLLRVSISVMRRVLIDRARRNNSQKRSQKSRARIAVENLEDDFRPGELEELLSIHEAMERLGEFDQVLHDLVELKVFGGQTIADTAKLLGISESTTKRKWALAQAWLFRELYPANEQNK